MKFMKLAEGSQFHQIQNEMTTRGSSPKSRFINFTCNVRSSYMQLASLFATPEELSGSAAALACPVSLSQICSVEFTSGLLAGHGRTLILRPCRNC